MRLCIFEDRAELLEPLSLTRPVFELRCGMTTLADKQRRAIGVADWGVLIRAHLEEVYRQQQPNIAVNDADWLRGDDVLLVNGRWLPPDGPFELPASACVGMAGDAVAFVMLPKGESTNFDFEELPERLRQCLDRLPTYQAGGRMIAYPWDLVDQNAREIRRDFGWLEAG